MSYLRVCQMREVALEGVLRIAEQVSDAVRDDIALQLEAAGGLDGIGSYDDSCLGSNKQEKCPLMLVAVGCSSCLSFICCGYCVCASHHR